jgi:hypothetical protein
MSRKLGRLNLQRLNKDKGEGQVFGEVEFFVCLAVLRVGPVLDQPTMRNFQLDRLKTEGIFLKSFKHGANVADHLQEELRADPVGVGVDKLLGGVRPAVATSLRFNCGKSRSFQFSDEFLRLLQPKELAGTMNRVSIWEFNSTRCLVQVIQAEAAVSVLLDGDCLKGRISYLFDFRNQPLCRIQREEMDGLVLVCATRGNMQVIQAEAAVGDGFPSRS